MLRTFLDHARVLLEVLGGGEADIELRDGFQRGLASLEESFDFLATLGGDGHACLAFPIRRRDLRGLAGLTLARTVGGVESVNELGGGGEAKRGGKLTQGIGTLRFDFRGERSGFGLEFGKFQHLDGERSGDGGNEGGGSSDDRIHFDF